MRQIPLASTPRPARAARTLFALTAGAAASLQGPVALAQGRTAGRDTDLLRQLYTFGAEWGLSEPWMVWTALGAALVVVLGVARALLRPRPTTHTYSAISIDDLNLVPDAPLSQLPVFGEAITREANRRKPDVIRLLNTVLSAGLSLDASDIHITPAALETRIALRVHGRLHDLAIIPSTLHPPLASRVKVASELAIYKKNTPQDGRLSIVGSQHTARVSLLPTNHGEKIVLRLTRASADVYNLERLGMMDDMLNLYRAILNRSQGVIVLTGPTGSGKTTTMYSSLMHIAQARGDQTNIVTLEDPIEYDLPGTTQTQIDSATGLTFAVGLRSVLRQDPDVIMLGEIRDEETADNAMRAAMTGHLIFTTVHADNAAGVFGRMIQIGIKPFHLTNAVCGVISQRLCPRLCPHCRTTTSINAQQQAQLRMMGLRDPEGPFYAAPGCDHCLGTGFHGRVPLFELLVVNDTLRDLINENASAHQIQRQAAAQGMHTLLDDGLRKARRGDVALDDVLRVIST